MAAQGRDSLTWFSLSSTLLSHTPTRDVLYSSQFFNKHLLERREGAGLEVLISSK